MLAILIEKPSPRIEYIFSLIFKDLLKIDFQIHYSFDTWNGNFFLKILYSSLDLPAENCPSNYLFFGKHAFIDENYVRDKLDLNLFLLENLPISFPHQAGDSAIIPYDVFAWCFYLVSRYEEYLPYTADHHGRFSAKESIAYKKNFLSLPLVNLWAKKIGMYLQKKFPSILLPTPQYRWLPTYDIDIAYLYLCRKRSRSIGGLLRDVSQQNWLAVRERINVLSDRAEDRYNTYAYLDALHQKIDVSPIYFFLFAKTRQRYDTNVDIKCPIFQQLVTRLSHQYELGIHPSYQSNTDFNILKGEYFSLSKMIQKDITYSRQHFLKLHLPKTYQELLKLGIQKDFSMGYADSTGFRASISTEYTWYDLSVEKSTSLRVVPFMAMDVTLKNYMGLPDKQVVSHLLELYCTVREVGGDFVTIFHNNIFSEDSIWKGWRKIYENFIAEYLAQP